MILDTRHVTHTSYSGPVKAYIYSIIKEDTNKDEKLTPSDAVTLSVSVPDGGNYTELFGNIRRLVGVKQTKDNEFVIIFDDNNVSYVASISINNFEVIYTHFHK